MAVEGAAGKRLDHLFDLDGDDIAVHEIGMVEDGMEEMFGQEVLHQHPSTVSWIMRGSSEERHTSRKLWKAVMNALFFVYPSGCAGGDPASGQ